MTSILHQRCTSILACVGIAVLLSFIIVVWVQYENGAFRPKHSANVQNSTRNESRKVKKAWNRHGDETEKEYVDRTHLDDLGHHSEIEFVKPLKLSPGNLHLHDKIYDQRRNNHGQPLLRHHSGHFRHKMAEVWDPHPQYEIHAFGHKLHLVLAYNDRFVSPNLQITHIWENYTQRVRHNPSTTSGCFYTGTVRGDSDSDVTVSLCNGMTGYIRTSDGNYYIEPVEKFQDVTSSILHRIKKVPHRTDPSATSNDVDYAELNLCETDEKSSNIITDDFVEDVYEARENSRKRRSVSFDSIDTEDVEETSETQLRTTRDVDYVQKAFVYGAAGERREGNNEYFIEILVVADKKMAEYHKNDQDLIHYVLTLMSHVAVLYKDATIGNAISIAVVDISILKNTEFKSANSELMLRKFCEWQHKHSMNHDVALLLTRETICRNTTEHMCNTLGVAEVGAMCSSSTSCAIVRDKGLSTSYTIAHELGHVLSMPHDDDRKCEKFNRAVKQKNIMGKMLQNDTKPWIWSSCSKHFLTDFLDSNRAACLLDAPDKDFITPNFMEGFPGETFEADEQCELEFGSGSKICSFMPKCGSLWCMTTDGSCTTQHMPWADGTPCDEKNKKWCHHGECISMDKKLLTPVAGGWGPWQSWGPCTRTCGGGITISKRACDSPPPANRGPYCTGRSTRYASCNTQPCDEDSLDFREEQCAEFHGITKGIPGLTTDVKWVPKYGATSPEESCKLYCRVNNTNSYYLLKEKVIDGTKCGLNSFDVCVNGICRPGGCDNKLESKIALDDCGVCGGDNSRCEEITGSFNISYYGYNRVVRIPKGSYNLDVRQRGYRNSYEDSNYLALVDGETGKYILNGNNMVSTYQKEITFAGTLISYSGAENVIERVFTAKHSKITKDLVLEVLSVGKVHPPDITYKYVISKDSAPRYGWRLYRKQWSKCSSICSGTQYMRPICVELAVNAHVSDSHCADLDMSGTMQQQECNTHCQLIWNVASKGHCSAHCGNGIRNVYYDCIKVDLVKNSTTVGTHGAVVDDKHCSVIPKPKEVENCQGSCNSTRWEYSEWTECSKSCGGGIQRRSAKCVENGSHVIDDAHCEDNEKVTQQVCNNQKCPTWSFGDWTPCSVSCGRGYRTKPYYCHVDGRIYNPQSCDQDDLPVVKEECQERPCVKWSTGRWSDCSATCGVGTKNRQVFCKSFDHDIVDDEQCADMLKPNDTKMCVQDDCDLYQRRFYQNDFEDNSISSAMIISYRWITGAWGQCSKTCDGGVMSRMVICRNDFGDENDNYCDQKTKPVKSVECNSFMCPAWIYGGWSRCDSYCERHRQVLCQNYTGMIVEDSQCDKNTKPAQMEKCLTNCQYSNFNSNENGRRYKWKVGKWGQCSKSCGKGTRTRQIWCKDAINDVSLVHQYCSNLKKPKTTKSCERNNCLYTWVEGEWSQCSKSCGEGLKRRNVSCHKVHAPGFVDPNPLPEPYHTKLYQKNYCDIYSKPPTTSKCLERKCTDLYSWSPGPWKQCSQPCGRKGRQTRQLFCVSRDNKKVQRFLCPSNLKPPRKRKCNQKKCVYRNCAEIKSALKTTQNKDYPMLIGNKMAVVYCYKMDTANPEEFITLQKDDQNYAEIYDKRLVDVDSCPRRGERHDDCDCIPVGPERSGFTTFWKVRLNITSLQIIANDFTFSINKGGKIPYATSGDCYSNRKGCPQGRFSVDLTGTSFRLLKGNKWRLQGHQATAQINLKERTVTGRCGGYCGNCSPEAGLVVEVT